MPGGTPLERGAAEHLDGLVFRDAETPEAVRKTFGVVRVGTNLAELVALHGAVVAVKQVGGITGGWQAIARLTVDVYAASYEDVWDAQAVIDADLTSGYGRSRGSVRFDSWKNESAAAEQPYPNGDLSVTTSIWRVSTRHLPA